MESENCASYLKEDIKFVNVNFEGINNTNRNYLEIYKESLQNEKKFDSLLKKVDSVQQELSSLDAFSSVIPLININKEDESIIDITYKLKEKKLHYSLGSTINKQGKIGFEASAFIPNIFGTLSTSKLSLETFGNKSREFSISLFTPKILLSNINMTYNLFRSVIDYNKSSSYTDTSFGGTVKLSNKIGSHNLTIESKLRNTPLTMQYEGNKNYIKRNNSLNYNWDNLSIQTIKNSVCYSWNNRINEESNIFEKEITNNNDKETEIKCKNTLQQLSLEYAGFSGDVQFIKLQGFQQWNTKLGRYFNRFNFLKKLNLDLNLGFGILFPNSIRNNDSFKTTIHDRFFVGGNFGFHNCLMGFASRSVGPCTPKNIDYKKFSDNCNKIKYDYLGSDGFASAELNLSYPLNLNKFGINIKPRLLAYLNNATVLDEKSDLLYSEHFIHKKTLTSFKETIRASTGIGISIPINFASLCLLFSIPIKHQNTDLTENIQLGMRMTYSPI